MNSFPNTDPWGEFLGVRFALAWRTSRLFQFSQKQNGASMLLFENRLCFLLVERTTQRKTARDGYHEYHVYQPPLQNLVEPFHLFRYLDEQAFRYNRRKMNDGERFDIVVRQIIGKRLTWNQLTGKQPEQQTCVN